MWSGGQVVVRERSRVMQAVIGDLLPLALGVAISRVPIIASSTVAGPVLGYLVAQARMAQSFDDLRSWLTDNNAAVMSALLLVLGVVIFGKGSAGL